MATNHILTEGLKIAQFYYGAQRYFSSLILAAEGVANRLTEQGWRITRWDYGRLVKVNHWSWSDDRGAHLPRSYIVLFNKGTAPSGQETDQYGFCLWFFTSDPFPFGGQSWVPTGFFFRATPRPGGNCDPWVVIPKIAEEVRTKLVHPQPSSAFLQYDASSWPSTLTGNGVDNQLHSLQIVPFPLACIATSDDLEALRKKAIQALCARAPRILIDNPEYLQRVWGLGSAAM